MRMSRDRFIDRLVALPPPAANTLLYESVLGANPPLRQQAISYERPGVIRTNRAVESAPSRPRYTAWAELMRQRTKFTDRVMVPLLEARRLEMTLPNKPRRSKQQYRITAMGRATLSKASPKDT